MGGRASYVPGRRRSRRAMLNLYSPFTIYHSLFTCLLQLAQALGDAAVGNVYGVDLGQDFDGAVCVAEARHALLHEAVAEHVAARQVARRAVAGSDETRRRLKLFDGLIEQAHLAVGEAHLVAP